MRNDGNIGVSAVYYGAPRADSGHLSKLDEACRKGGPQSCTAWSMAAFSPVLASHSPATKQTTVLRSTALGSDGQRIFTLSSVFWIFFDFSDLFAYDRSGAIPNRYSPTTLVHPVLMNLPHPPSTCIRHWGRPGSP